MAKMKELYMEMLEIARHGTIEDRIRQFGSVQKAEDWLRDEDRREEESARAESEIPYNRR